MDLKRRFARIAAAVALTTGVLVTFPASPASPSAFPGANGKIAFTSERDGNWEVYIMNADGSGQTNLTNHQAIDGDAVGPPTWSPAGSKIAFAKRRTRMF